MMHDLASATIRRPKPSLLLSSAKYMEEILSNLPDVAIEAHGGLKLPMSTLINCEQCGSQ
jgi:hypothetical protein